MKLKVFMAMIFFLPFINAPFTAAAEKTSPESSFTDEVKTALLACRQQSSPLPRLQCYDQAWHPEINVYQADRPDRYWLQRIIGATLGFKSMKTAYATIKGIEVMRALRKGQASAFYYGDPLGEMRLVSRVFEM